MSERPHVGPRSAIASGGEPVILMRPTVGGAIGAEELAAFRSAATALHMQNVGAFLQNPAAIAQAASLADAGHALWVDIREVIRTHRCLGSARSSLRARRARTQAAAGV